MTTLVKLRIRTVVDQLTVTTGRTVLLVLVTCLGCGEQPPPGESLNARATPSAASPQSLRTPDALPSPQANKPYRVGGDVLPPQVITRIHPDLSRLPGHLHAHMGVLEATIGSDGHVRNVRIVRSLAPQADPLVVTALKKWKFRPATKKGKPVAVYLTLTVNIHPR